MYPPFSWAHRRNVLIVSGSSEENGILEVDAILIDLSIYFCLVPVRAASCTTGRETLHEEIRGAEIAGNIRPKLKSKASGDTRGPSTPETSNVHTRKVHFSNIALKTLTHDAG